MTLARRKPMPRATKPMPRRSAKRAAYLASDAGKAGLAHMARVRALPCVVCGKPGPSDVHHCIHGRYSARRVSDFKVISLCEKCHRHPHPLAIHTNKNAWAERNGFDYEFLAVVADMLAGEFND